MKNLKLNIDQIGQPYVDDPVYVRPRKDLLSPVGMAVSAIYNGGRPGIPQELMVGYARVKLNWIRPKVE